METESKLVSINLYCLCLHVQNTAKSNNNKKNNCKLKETRILFYSNTYFLFVLFSSLPLLLFSLYLFVLKSLTIVSLHLRAIFRFVEICMQSVSSDRFIKYTHTKNKYQNSKISIYSIHQKSLGKKFIQFFHTVAVWLTHFVEHSTQK